MVSRTNTTKADTTNGATISAEIAVQFDYAVEKSLMQTRIVTIEVEAADWPGMLVQLRYCAEGLAETRDAQGREMIEAWGAYDGNEWRVRAIRVDEKL